VGRFVLPPCITIRSLYGLWQGESARIVRGENGLGKLNASTIQLKESSLPVLLVLSGVGINNASGVLLVLRQVTVAATAEERRPHPLARRPPLPARHLVARQGSPRKGARHHGRRPASRPGPAPAAASAAAAAAAGRLRKGCWVVSVRAVVCAVVCAGGVTECITAATAATAAGVRSAAVVVCAGLAGLGRQRVKENAADAA